MNNQSSVFPLLLKLLILGLTVTGTVACQSGPGARSEQPGKFTVRAMDAFEYTVKPGESLSRIARRLTTDVSNWREIARYNNIENPQAIEAGQILLIPNHLLPPPTDIGTAQVETISATPTEFPAPDNQSSDLAGVNFQPTSAPGVARARVILRAVNVNRKFQIIRFDNNTNTQSKEGTSSNSQQPERWIRVLGTYFPIGVYENPSNLSNLIMLVKPGSIFSLSHRVGKWLRIETQTGTGYIRADDAEILDTNPEKKVVLSANSPA